jgi:cytochrome c-type biogenesis protein CcmH/NrfF
MAVLTRFSSERGGGPSPNAVTEGYRPLDRGTPFQGGIDLRWTRAVAFFAIVAGLWFAAAAAAQDTLPPAPYAYRQLDDPVLEAKAQGLMETLRCLKCQSQSIADSDAPMAGDMRSQVRQRIAAGEEPEAIRAWLVERYGDYVSYAPRVTQLTWPLFAAPLFLLALAALLLRRRFGKSGGSAK